MRRSLVLMLIGMSALPVIADAQTVVMRKTLGGKLIGTGNGGDKPPIVTHAPAPVLGSWTTSAPRLIGPSCSATAPATRDVWCALADGTRLQDSGCAGEGVRPSTSTTIPNYDGCGHVWQPVGGTTWSSTCSDEATATRHYICQRQDGAKADASKCDATHQETETETGANLTTCVFEVSAWRSKSYSSDCSSKAVVTYEATSCIRSGGGEYPKQVSVEQCRAAGEPMTKDNVQEVYYGCDYTPTYSTTYGTCANGEQSAPIASCRRSDGTDVPVAECSASKQSTTRTCVATPPGPVAKANCSTATPNTVLSTTTGSYNLGYATTPYLPNGAWQTQAMALCRSFEYGSVGKCFAMWISGSAIVSVYGYSNTGTSAEAKPSHVTESISTVCTAL